MYPHSTCDSILICQGASVRFALPCGWPMIISSSKYALFMIFFRTYHYALPVIPLRHRGFFVGSVSSAWPPRSVWQFGPKMENGIKRLSQGLIDALLIGSRTKVSQPFATFGLPAYQLLSLCCSWRIDFFHDRNRHYSSYSITKIPVVFICFIYVYS